MPTWATGKTAADFGAGEPKPTPESLGFTLLELLVVLLIIGLISAFAAHKLQPHPDRELRLEGERLAAQLDVIRQLAWTQGQPQMWQATDRGFTWSQSPHPSRAGDEATTTATTRQAPFLRWLSSSIRAHPEQLDLPAEPVAPPLMVELTLTTHPGWRAIVRSNGTQPFAVFITAPTTP